MNNSWSALVVTHSSTEKPSLTRAEIPSLLASLEGSTCMIDHPQFVQLIEPLLYAKVGRGEAAIQRSQERSANIRGAIQKAAGPSGLDWPLSQLAGVVHRRLQAHPHEYGLVNAPSMVTIRDEISRLKENTGFGSEVKIGLWSNGFNESSTSTST